MTPQLMRRLARAMDVGAASPAVRDRIVAAAHAARTFDDLPSAIRALITRLEQRPAA